MTGKPNGPLQGLLPGEGAISCFVDLVNINGVVIIKPDVPVDYEVVLVHGQRHKFVGHEHAAAAHPNLVLGQSHVVILNNKLVQVRVEQV